MDKEDNKITLYTSQGPAVLEAILKNGVCFNKEIYIKNKYEDVAGLFLTCYRRFVLNASAILPPPDEAEFPYLAFKDARDMFTGSDSQILKLEVPIDEAVFFDVYDWNKILQFRLLGTEEEEKAFSNELKRRGITETEVITTPFYPDLKRKVMDSWKNLFRHNEEIKAGNFENLKAIEAAIWQIKREWIVK